MPLRFIDKGESNTQIDVRTGTISIGHIGKDVLSCAR
jgi:hypothetical protein